MQPHLRCFTIHFIHDSRVLGVAPRGWDHSPSSNVILVRLRNPARPETKAENTSCKKKTFFSAVKTKVCEFYYFRCAEFKNALRFAVSHLVNWQ